MARAVSVSSLGRPYAECDFTHTFAFKGYDVAAIAGLNPVKLVIMTNDPDGMIKANAETAPSTGEQTWDLVRS